MTTLRDYILDCRCPNCGTSMQQCRPKRKSWMYRVAPFAVAFLLVSATVYAFKGDYAHAAFDVTLATLLAVTDK